MPVENQMQEMPGNVQPEDQAGDMNPVLEAINTLQTFIAAQKEKGNPKSGNMAEALLSLVQVISGEGTGPDEGKIPQSGVTQPVRGESGMPEMAAKGARPAMPSL